MKRLFTLILALTMVASMMVTASAESTNYEKQSFVYLDDYTGRVFYDCPRIITTRTAQPDGTLSERFDYNLFSGGLTDTHTMVYTGAYITVDNIIKETPLEDGPLLFSNGPVNVTFAGGPDNYAGVREISKFTSEYTISNGYIVGGNSKYAEHSDRETVLDVVHPAGAGCETVYQTETLTEPGLYTVFMNSNPASIGMDIGCTMWICILDGTEDLNDNIAKTATATPNSTQIQIDGKAWSCPAYLINGNNYIKIRDIAWMMRGTARAFDTYYLPQIDCVYINTTYTEYEAVGGEFKSLGTGTKTAQLSTQDFKTGIGLVHPLAYIIDGSNYVMLRDIAKILNFKLDYDNATATVNISTATGYVY